MPEAKFYYRQHERNISSNQRELWNVRARMLVDECFNELSKNSCCVIPILEKSSLFGQLTLEPFLGFSTLLEYELNRLNIEVTRPDINECFADFKIVNNIHNLIRVRL